PDALPISVQGVDRRLGQGDHGQPAGDVEGDPFLLAHEWSYHPLPLLRPSSPAAALRIDSSGGWNFGSAVSVWMLREALTNTSMPVRSMVSSGPMAWPKPRRQAVSMSSAVATPLSTSFTASTLSATISRVVTNPAMSRLTTTQVLPRSSAKAVARARVSSLVLTPRTTSHSRIIGTGEKKWVPTTRSGRAVTAAIRVIGRALVSVASTEVRGAS